jgi:hypothetical protein
VVETAHDLEKLVMTDKLKGFETVAELVVVV